MIYRHKIGNPFETQAVVNFENTEEKNDMDFLELLGNMGIRLYTQSIDGSEGVAIDYSMDDKTLVFGLGESARGMNKRGYVYVSDNTDEPHQSEDKNSLYGAHNFIAVRGVEEDFGLFFDYPSKMQFDIGYTDRNLIHITVPSKDLYIYLITGCSLREIAVQFRKMTGKSYIAPLWGLGFGQSRWGYKNEDDIREVVNGYRKAGIPLDSVYMDIDYMESYKDFTISRERFPRFADFVEEMREQGIRLVPIIDAGVKIEKDYDIYEEGKAKGYFCTNEDSSLFSVGVWPGWTHFPDFFKPEAREWFGDCYENLTQYGIEGFWNDMNEPAIFYTDKGIEKTVEKVCELAKSGDEITPEQLTSLKDMIDGWRDHSWYKTFYHLIDGKRISHDKLHNLYGFNMTRAAAESLEKLIPDEYPLLFSRSSYIGMHRYSGIWMGDNKSWWSHLLMNIQMLPGVNMCGFIYSGADIGGFGCDTNEELMLRWTELGIFTPLFRNHSCIGTRRQECYRFTNTAAFKEIISLRYRLIPYIYSEYLKAVMNDDMLFRPLAFDYEDDAMARSVEDQLMFGEGLMLTPVYMPNVSGRYVYLPENMLFIKFSTSTKYTTCMMPKGHHYIEVKLTEVAFFLRPGCVLPLGVSEVCVDDLRRYNEAGKRGELEKDDFEIISAVMNPETVTSEENDDERDSAETKAGYTMYTQFKKNIVINEI